MKSSFKWIVAVLEAVNCSGQRAELLDGEAVAFWTGEDIVAAYTSEQIEQANSDGKVVVDYDASFQPVVGRLNGQTGWHWAAAVEGEEPTLRYQFAIEIKAVDGKSLADIFAVDAPDGQSTQLAWWIPKSSSDSETELIKNLAEINLKSELNETTIKML